MAETNFASVICGTETLVESDYMSINENDIIGVGIPSPSSLHVVASEASGYSLKRYASGEVVSLGSAVLEDLMDQAMHLHADIMTTSTPVPATTSLDTDFMTTRSSDVPMSTMDISGVPPQVDTVDSGLVAGIIVAVVVVIAVFVVVVVILLFLRKRTKSYKMNANSPKWGGAINNGMYDRAGILRGDTISKITSPSFSNNTYDLVDPVYDTADRSPEFEDTPETYYSAIRDIPEYQSLINQAKQDGDVTYGDPSPYRVPAREEDELYRQIKHSGINRIAKSSIELTDYLGSGEFGEVEQGTMKTSSDVVIDVAVKTMAKDATQIDKVRFLQEAVIMAQFKHPNVVNMYGVVKDKAMLMLIVELLSKGDLRNFLIALRRDLGQLIPTYVPKQLLAFCQQVALGMQYLSTRGFVHRDLAARNVLVSENSVCKIGDFGMSRDLADDTYYVSHGGKIPVKWTAPEAIHFRKYSTASDVWSYGCLLYEIWRVGHKPFEDHKNVDVIQEVDAGYRLPPPPGCPMAVYDIMIQCWHPDSASRPTFRDVLLILLGNEADILEIPSDALSSHRQAGVLGASLEAGETMYRELQISYT